VIAAHDMAVEPGRVADAGDTASVDIDTDAVTAVSATGSVVSGKAAVETAAIETDSIKAGHIEASVIEAGATDADVSRVVLFDFDGVLIHGDAFGLFMRDRYRRSLLRKLLVLPTLPWLLLGWPISWRIPVRTLVHICLLGVSEARYAAAARVFAAQLVRRPKLFCRDGVLALRRHQAAGDRVIVVTGCEHALVTGILDELGLSDLEVLASQLRPGAIGMRIKLHNVGKRKLQTLAAHGLHAWRRAYSDSSQDIPMLRPAGEAVLVNGTPKLCMKIERALGRSVTRVDWF
jgi:phosphatidylglycerophosphatase C